MLTPEAVAAPRDFLDLLQCLCDNGKTAADVYFVSADNGSQGTWEEFRTAVGTFVHGINPRQQWSAYDGFQVVGSSWWIERVQAGMYDSEWKFMTLPSRNFEAKALELK